MSAVCLSVYLTAVCPSVQLQETDDDPLARMGQKGQKIVSCRICKGDHWTIKCPYKDSLAPLQDALEGADKKKPADDEPAGPGGAPGGGGGPPGAGGGPPQRAGKYVPPSMRDGGNKKGDSMSMKTRGARGKLILGESRLLMTSWF